MLAVFAGWLLLASIVIGLGELALRVFPARTLPPSLGDLFWAGFGALLLLLQPLQLVLPLGRGTLLGFIPIAAWGLVVLGRALRRWRTRNDFAMQLGAFGIAAVGLAWLALAPIGNADSGLYHLPMVTWLARYRLVPGLANLNPLFGLHTAYFLYLAIIDTGPWIDRVQHVGPSLLVLVLVFESLASLLTVFRRPLDASAEQIAGASILPPVLELTASPRDFSSCSADLAVGVLMLALLTRMVRIASDRERALADAGVVALLATEAVLVKLSLAVTAGVSLLVWLGLVLSRHCRLGGRVAGRASAIFAVGVAGWVARSVVLSGYPAFPAMILPTGVSWQISEAEAIVTSRYVLAWGRSSGGPAAPLLSGWGWFRPWALSLLSENQDFVVPMLVLVGGIVLLSLAAWRGAAGIGSLAWVLLPFFSGLLFWLLTAPDLRFQRPVFWTLAAAVLTFALRATRSAALERGAISALALCGVWLLSDTPRPNPTLLALSPAPAPDVRSFKTSTGTSISVPAEGLCWAAAPPCTPFVRGDFDVRTAGRIESGFRHIPGAPSEVPGMPPTTVIPDVR